MQKKVKSATAIPITLLALLLILPSLTLLSTGVSPLLKLIPLVAVAPDDPTGFSIANPACVAPLNEFGQPHTSAFIHCYTPSNIYAAYGVDQLHAQGINGTGQTIVIVDSYGSPTALHDLQFFSQTFHLPAPDLTILNPTGTPTFNPAQKGIQVGWAEETSLDLQWAHSIAPNAKLVLVEANPAETEGTQGFPSIFKGEEFAVNTYPGSVLTQSFGVTEQSFCGGSNLVTTCASAASAVSHFDQVYHQAVANHVTVFASAGDSGTANIARAAGTSAGPLLPFPSVIWPTSDPLVTSAGGTWLQYGWKWNPNVTTTTYFQCLSSGTDPNTCAASYLNYNTAPGRTEAVWKEDWLPAATGGGLSTLFSTPSFQSGISQSLLKGSRGVPDLSWNSAVDGGVLVYTSFPGVRLGWHIIGGTSASSPQLAGLIALTNQLAANMGKHSVGYLNPLLYQLPARDFNDIVPQTFGTGAGVTTLASNPEFGTSIPGMATTTGWDLTTGFGSPNAFNFVHDLANALPS